MPTSAVPACPVTLALLAIETVFAATAPSRAAMFWSETAERGAYTVIGTFNATLFEKLDGGRDPRVAHHHQLEAGRARVQVQDRRVVTNAHTAGIADAGAIGRVIDVDLEGRSAGAAGRDDQLRKVVELEAAEPVGVAGQGQDCVVGEVQYPLARVPDVPQCLVYQRILYTDSCVVIDNGRAAVDGVEHERPPKRPALKARDRRLEFAVVNRLPAP